LMMLLKPTQYFLKVNLMRVQVFNKTDSQI
jgi:hypothetical protein